MKKSKIIATLVVLAMLLSTLVVFNQLNIVNKANAQPGVDEWGQASTEIVYDESYSTGSVKINTSQWIANGTYYLYYPNYWSVSPGYATNFTWDGPFEIDGIPVKVEATKVGYTEKPGLDTLNFAGGSSITFLRAGMWVFADSIPTAADDWVGYLWVNTSTSYSISAPSSIGYGSAADVTITVTEGGSNVPCMISVLDPLNNTIYSDYTSGTTTLDQDYFEYAGDYTIRAYKDLDKYAVTYLYADEGGDAYGPDYGMGIIPASGYYNYTYVGPWDPPEKNATEKTLTVTTGKPNIVLTNTTLYWGYEARIDVNVTDGNGDGLDCDMIDNPIMLKYGSKYVIYGDVSNLGDGNYSITFPEFTGWYALASALGDDNVNGTWRVVFSNNSNHDDTDEWNNTAIFSVKSAHPPVQLKIVNDGSGDPDDKEVDVPAYAYDGHAATIDITFDIIGRSITNEYRNAYYGDDLDEYEGVMDNLTIEGDLLYPVVESDLTWSVNGRWTASVTPMKPGGTITITIDWPGDENGTASQTLTIVNGSHVQPAVDAFTVGSDYNLTVTVLDMDEAPLKYAMVYLMWEDTGEILNETEGTNKVGRGLNGQYTFWITADDQYDIAPQNITIAASAYDGSSFWGYGKVIMDRHHNMIVNITPTTAYAGDAVEYDILVSLVGGGHPDTADLTVALFNETGENLWTIWYKDNAYEILDEEIILDGGTYHIAAMNNTCDSKDHNATFVVTNYIVTSEPSILAWMIDDETNMTFTVTPAGNGTLTLYNMSGAPEAALIGDTTEVGIENGVGTLDEVDASTLGNVTFSYQPDFGDDRMADGLLRITTATATPNPATIYIGEPTLVTVTITHPATGTPLEDVNVSLEAWNATSDDTVLAKIPDNDTTDADGQVTFSVTAMASGEIPIYIENATDPNNEFFIVAAARKPMTIELNPSVNEGVSFTAEAKSNGILITNTTVTFTFNQLTYPTQTGVATIPAPTITVGTSLTYPITATAEGYTTATAAIVVINIPKMIIAISGDVETGKTFTVTIADDTGSPVIGATITFNGNTYTTVAGGSTTVTAPSTEGTYPVTVTFPGYETLSDNITVTKGSGIPGFELLTLIAAIGVAFLLLRRRRN
jgi:hypothetical protein